MKVKNTGFTLIEILIATTIFLVVLSISVVSFLASSKSVRKIASDREVHQAARLAFEQMSRDFRMAKAVACQEGGVVNNCLQLNPNDSRLKSDHVRICAQDGVTVRDYRLDSQKIYRRDKNQFGQFNDLELTPTGIFVQGRLIDNKLFQLSPSHPTSNNDTTDPCQKQASLSVGGSIKTQPFVEFSAQFSNYDDPANPPTQPEKGAVITLQTMVTLRNFVKQY